MILSLVYQMTSLPLFQQLQRQRVLQQLQQPLLRLAFKMLPSWAMAERTGRLVARKTRRARAA
jgi:hypothetical protein